MSDALRIGVLCLQGDYEAHGRVLARLGVDWRDVRRGCDLDGLDGLVLPGGESTTMWHFLSQDGLESGLRRLAARGAAFYGTCAGAILLARRVCNPEGRGLGLLDITVERNSYGRQLQSAVREADIVDGAELGAAPPGGAATRIEAILIRAPRILDAGPSVRIRARLDGDPVWVEQGRIMATTFHPELGGDTRAHRRFLALAAAASGALAARG